MLQDNTCLNQKTFTLPVWVLVCIEIFSAWQMGVIYYASEAFTVNGVTPLPVNIDSTTSVIISGYLAGALFAFLFPCRAAFVGKIILPVSLVCTALLFFSLPPEIAAAAFYVTVFLGVLFISIDAVLIVTLYSSKAAIIAAICSGLAVAVFTPLLQNNLYIPDFRVFNAFAIITQMLVLAGISRLPNSLPVSFLPTNRGKQKSGRNNPPGLLFFGTLLLCFSTYICTVFCSTMAESLPNGIATAYSGCGVGTICFLCFYKRKKSPMQLTTILLAAVAFGFLMFLLPYRPLKYAGLFLQGSSTFVCALSWFYVGLCFEKWRARSITPAVILLALFAVFVNAGLMELLRNKADELYAIYAVLAVVLLLLYFLVKPFCENSYYATTQNESDKADEPEPSDLFPAESATKETTSAGQPDKNILSLLTKREAEIADLISLGYSNGNIAKTLYISEETVKGHTKNIYRKLEIHSRFELAAIINRIKNSRGQ